MDNVASIISSIAAVLGVIGTIYTVLINQTTRKILPPNHSLVIIRVLRIPLDWDVWKRRKKTHTQLHNFTDVSFGLFILAELGNIIIRIAFFHENAGEIFSKVFSISGVGFGIIILFTYSFIGLNIYLRRQKFGKTPEEGRFFIFKDAIVIVQAEYSDIVIRCYEALKMLNVKSVELDLNTQILEGQKTIRLKASIGMVKIEIQPTYQVMIDRDAKREYAIKVSFITYHSNSIELTSEVTNAFIEQFMGQTKP